MNIENIKVLVADDTPANVKIIQSFLEMKGYSVIVAENGAEAIEQFKLEKPDIILMDVMMPEVDGYEATREIKKIAGDNWIPLIFLSAKTTIDDQIFGIKLGGDDYLLKPVELRLLEVKLTSMLRIVKLQRKIQSYSDALKIYSDKSAIELDLAKNLMENMCQKYSDASAETIRIYASAAEEISGDLAVTYACEKTNRLYTLLADATGHGLSAAISLVPLTQAFYRLATEGKSLDELVRSINRSLGELLPTGRFVAATVAIVDSNNQTISLWSGSNPDAYYVNAKGEVEYQFVQRNFAFGVVSDDVFSTNIETFEYAVPGEFICYSDGVTDLVDAKGNEFGEARLLKGMLHPKENDDCVFDVLVDQVRDFGDFKNKLDDVTIMSIRCI